MTAPRAPPSNPVQSGSIVFDGRELVCLPEREFRRLRRNQIGFLDSPSPRRLDPQARIGRVLAIRLPGRTRVAGGRARRRAVDLLARVGVETPETVLGCYLARALVRPERVVTIDPTRELDPDAAARFLDLLHDLQRERGFTLLVVSTRLEVVRRCDRVAVVRSAPSCSTPRCRSCSRAGPPGWRELLTENTTGLARADS